MLIHCSLARELRDTVFALLGCNGWCLWRVIDLLACWQGRLGRNWNSKIWKPFLIAWCGAYGGSEMLEILRGVNGIPQT